MGDAKLLRRELAEARGAAEESGVGLGRRLAAIAVATPPAMIAAQATSLIIRNGFFVSDASYRGAARAFWVSVAAEAILMLLAQVGLYGVLRQWRRRERAGDDVWYLTTSPLRLGLVMAGLLALYAVVPFLSTWPLIMPGVMVPEDPNYGWLLALFTLVLAPWAMQALIWFRWADAGGRRVLNLACAMAVWVGFLTVCHFIQAKQTWHAEAHGGGFALRVGWLWPTLMPWHALERPVFAGLVALAVYVVWRGAGGGRERASVIEVAS
jgi:hypothetical protein